MSAIVRGLGIYVGVPDHPRLRGCANRKNRGWLDRGDEDYHRSRDVQKQDCPRVSGQEQNMTTPFRKDALAGKRILVSGGGSGLGKEISRGLAMHGATVYVCGRRE